MYIDTLDSEGAFWFGGAGNDTFKGSLYNDFMFGGAGNDTFLIESATNSNVYSGGDGTDVIHVTKLGPYQIFAAIEILSITGIEEIRSDVTTAPTYIYMGRFLPEMSNNPTGGGENPDFLNLRDVNLVNIDGIRGAGQADTIIASNGDDLIDGWTNSDTLTGADGADTFHFEQHYNQDFGNDTVTDFTDEDTIQFTTDVFADAAAVFAAAAQVGADTVITYDANNSVTLQNVALASLTADDFSFV
ncbi:hypothetical protein JM93_01547 [Roseibium hamelinense]|uniref:Hemolysin type calcium-binding protein n=1 Tax=Roseibium hamelinense TaxID=150831 RepID=A0A562TAU4_9HYPH|nr:hypothetical protein [Roseibium hamelinense]MTI42222.1 hypothetical protein [Roseibium hamelinense]TWI90563.1 hypothetical protein JM93_01547 [Roseibium hamelinense]